MNLQELKKLVPEFIENIKLCKTASDDYVNFICLTPNLPPLLISKADMLRNTKLDTKSQIYEIGTYINELFIKELEEEVEATSNESKFSDLCLFFEQKICEKLKEFKNLCYFLDDFQTGIVSNLLKNFKDGNFNNHTLLLNQLEFVVLNLANKKNLDPQTPNYSDLLNDQIKIIMEKIDSLNSCAKAIQKTFNQTPIFLNSAIVKIDEIDMVHQWLKSQLLFEKINTQIIYDSKVHGFQAHEFHKRCDSKGPTLIFVQSVEGKRFGGYANCRWFSSSEGEWVNDNKCFLFSLDYKEKYLHKKEESRSIFGHSRCGPYFGAGTDLYLNDNCNSVICGGDQKTFEYNGRSHSEIGMARPFTVKNYEVYLITFNQYKKKSNK